jgi:hypothetical protein
MSLLGSERVRIERFDHPPQAIRPRAGPALRGSAAVKPNIASGAIGDLPKDGLVVIAHSDDEPNRAVALDEEAAFAVDEAREPCVESVVVFHDDYACERWL